MTLRWMAFERSRGLGLGLGAAIRRLPSCFAPWRLLQNLHFSCLVPSDKPNSLSCQLPQLAELLKCNHKVLRGFTDQQTGHAMP